MNNVDIYIDAAPVEVDVAAAQGPSGGGGGGGGSWSTLTDKPAWTGTFTGAYSSLTGIPTSFTPATHTHAFSSLTGIPGTFTPASHVHAWGDITSGVPSSFTPSAHTHTATDLDYAGSTEIGAALVDADEFMVSDGGGNTTRRKSLVSRIYDYILSKLAATPLPLANGGTGAATAGDARTNLKVPASDPTGVSGADAVSNIITLTQAEYDAIGTPDASTLYVIV